jgi:hypothetical protein
MTLTADPRARSSARPGRSGSPLSAPSAAPAPASLGPSITTIRALDDVVRVLADGRTIGYVQLAGPVYVCLLGEVYNTSVEVAQCLDLDTAVTRLERARA